MAIVLQVAEAIGQYPSCMAHVEVPLIPQGPKIRPIGLFVAFVRIHGKARRPIVRRWLSVIQKTVGGFENLAGRRTGDSVWRTQVLGSLANARKHDR